MDKKGLCEVCSNGRSCFFTQKFPVWQCEEFNGCVLAIGKKRSKTTKSGKGAR